MTDYSNTIIYMIHKPDSDLETYVGHTINFDNRFTKHKCRFNGKDFPHCNLPLYKYMREHGKFNDYKMEIIAYYPCNSKREAEEREQYYIDLLKSKLNTDRAYTSNEDSIIRKKKTSNIYYENNKEALNKQSKIYNEINKEAIAKQSKIYYIKNKEVINKQNKINHEKNKERYNATQKKNHEKNKEKRNARLREKIKCDICGYISNRGNLLRHQKSIKCQSFNS